MTLAQLKGYASAHAVVDAENRYAQAETIRIAVWGKPEDMKALRPSYRRATSDDDEYDETGLAAELASFGFVEVPRE